MSMKIPARASHRVYAVALVATLSAGSSKVEAQVLPTLAAGQDAPRPGQETSHAVDRVLTDAAVGGAAGARISEHMDVEAEELASVLEGLRVERLSEGIKVTVDVGVVFDPDSERLAAGTMDYLSRISRRLIAFEGADVLVVGHAAGAAPGADNLSLSERRALVAVEYLASEGVARDRLSHLGRGESEPFGLSNIVSEALQRANRRIEIAIFASDQMKAAARLETGGGE